MRSNKYIPLLSTGLFLIPLLAVLYNFFPSGNVLEWPVIIILPEYSGWSTFVWQFNMLLIPALVSITLIIVLPKNKTPWQLIALLGEMLFIMIWFMWHMLDNLRNIADHNILITVLVSTTIVLMSISIRAIKKPTEREKKEQLLSAIDQLTNEDLPQLFLYFLDIEIVSSEIGGRRDELEWKKILRRDVESGKIGTQVILEKFAEIKKRHS